MDTPAFHGGHKYCHNGGMASPTTTTGLAAERCRAEGSAIGIVAPFRRSPETAVLQVKRLGGPRFTPFGVRNGLVRLFLQTQEVLPQRGHGLRPRSRRRLARVAGVPAGLATRGVRDRYRGPLRGPQEATSLQGKRP